MCYAPGVGPKCHKAEFWRRCYHLRCTSRKHGSFLLELFSSTLAVRMDGGHQQGGVDSTRDALEIFTECFTIHVLPV